MINILIGNLFESNASTFVNTVNCVGVMGKGIAVEFKKRYPEMFRDYVERCKAGQVEAGVPYIYKHLLDKTILNFPTKKHWRSPARLDDIIHGLEILAEKYQGWGIESIALPPLGCGNGGLSWELVGPIMYQKLADLEIPVEIYAPYGTSNKLLTKDFLGQKNTSDCKNISGRTYKRLKPSWVALLEVVNKLQEQRYTNPIGRVIFQKICYVMTELNVDTGFKFEQKSYGPFSNDIQEVLSIFANSNLITEQQLGKMTALKIGNEYQSIREAFAEKLLIYSTKIDKTVDLFSRIKNTEQAEEVTTVLFTARKLKSENAEKIAEVSEKDVFDYILQWKKSWAEESKQKIVASTIRNLEMLGWLKLTYSESLPMQEDEEY